MHKGIGLGEPGAPGAHRHLGKLQGRLQGRMQPCSTRTSVPTQLSAWALLDSAGRRQGVKERERGEGEEGRQR